MKEYLLSLIDNPFKSFFVSAALLHSFFIALSISIAKEFKEIEKFLEHHDSWS